MPDKKLIFAVDDEKDILELLKETLVSAGYETLCFLNGGDLFTQLENSQPDLFILDLMLPDIDGLDICKKLKADEELEHIPVIMLTAKSTELDKILGLEIGADDYMTKPFSPRELIARIKAVLRRYGKSKPAGTPVEKLEINKDIHLDLNRYKLYIRNTDVHLTVTEFKILAILAERPGWVFSREQILNHLWGGDRYSIDRTVDVHIKHLRDKLGEYGSLIENVRGMGYKLLEK